MTPALLLIYLLSSARAGARDSQKLFSAATSAVPSDRADSRARGILSFGP